jgi:ribonuclease E
VQAFAMSRFSLVEISRKRVGPSLAEMLARRCPACEGAGTLPGLRWRVEQLMHRLAELPPASVTVLAAPDLHDYLTGTGRGAWEAGANRPGISLRRDPSLAPGDYRIEELS